MVEHGTENAGVDSSSLSLGTTPLFASEQAEEDPSFTTQGFEFIREPVVGDVAEVDSAHVIPQQTDSFRQNQDETCIEKARRSAGLFLGNYIFVYISV